MCWSSLRSAPFTCHNLAGTTLVAGVEFVVRKEQTCNSHKNKEDANKDKTEEDSEKPCGIFKVVQVINA